MRRHLANQAIVPVGAGGRISLAVGAGASHVLVDVQGWYGAPGAPDGADLRTSSPARILDTRTNAAGAPAGPLAGGAVRSVLIAGRRGVPTSGASAVVVNLTVVGATHATHLTAWPTGQAKPATSNVNVGPGRVVANQAVVPIGPDGRINLVLGAGTAHVVVDVQGWFGPTD